MHAVNKQLLAGQTGAASFDTGWVPVGANGFRNITFTAAWTAVALTAGVLSLEGTDDPAQASTSAVPLTLTATHGTWPNVGTAAGNAMVGVSDAPAFVRLKYVRSAGGGAGQFNVWATQSE